MKNTTRILPLVFSVLLLLVFVTASARARNNPNPAPPVPDEIIGQIRWKKDMGLIPARPGSAQASTSACSAFFIYAKGIYDNSIAYSPGSTSQPKEEGGYFVCNYSMQVRLDRDHIQPGLGDVGLLSKMSRLPYYLTDQWIGGTNSRPAAGYTRGFDKLFRIPQESKAFLIQFEMIYVYNPDYKPNLDSSSEKGASPFLRAASFAGAWHAKLGEGLLELILQQAGNRVTGQVKMNSADVGIIRDGIVVGNTLRFTIMRLSRPGLNSEFVYAGNGELVMDEGGKSFTGNVLGTATSGGTLIAR